VGREIFLKHSKSAPLYAEADEKREQIQKAIPRYAPAGEG